MMLAFIPTFSWAETVEIGGICYELSVEWRTAEVTTRDVKYSGDIKIPETVYDDATGIFYDVTSISDGAFQGCSITSISLPSNLISIGDRAFASTSLVYIQIPENVEVIGDGAFQRCSNLKNAVIGDGVTTIGNSAFADNTEMQNVTIGENVRTIGQFAFQGCSFESVRIPDHVVEIGYGAFFSCRSLKAVTLGDNVQTIGDMAFYSCDGLTSVVMETKVTKIGSAAFGSCTALTSIQLPYSLISIGESAFSGCTSLESCNIPGNVAVIPPSLFSRCTSLTAVKIPNNVSLIGRRAFWGCSNLMIVEMGQDVKTIQSLTFSGCEKLSHVYSYALTAPNTANDAFKGVHLGSATLHISEAAVNDYVEKSPWSDFGRTVFFEGGLLEVKKCAPPVISIEDGNLVFTCETPHANFVSEVTCPDAGKYETATVPLSLTYTITVYATAPGFEDSDVVTKTIQFSNNHYYIDGEPTITNLTRLIEQYLNVNTRKNVLIHPY